MAQISLFQVSLAYGHVPLLDKVDFSLEAKERVGLIGRNGTGKSSMLKILAQLEPPDEGQVQQVGALRCAHVRQEPHFEEGATVFEAVSRGLQEVIRLREAYLQSAPGTDLDALQTEIEHLGGWTWEQRVASSLERLGLRADDRVEDLSGGNQKRIALAQALVTEPDVLLLDEPTNHLDIQAIQWLEELLLDFKGSVVLISHDRAFLDRVTTRIVELDRGRLRSYPGNFAQYQVLKEAQLSQEAVEHQRADKLLAQEEIWIRKGVEARRTRAQGRISRLEALRAQRAQRREQVGRVKLDIDSGSASGKIVAELEGVCKHFGTGDTVKDVIRDLSVTLLRGDKIGIIGPNGAGKTTLLKLILGELEPDHGSVRRGSNLKVAYFDQMREQLNLDSTLEDFISPGSEWIEINGRRTHVKSYLGDFLFSPARAHAPIRTLSGGERNRLLLARLFARPANVLVLDEPTNDLDIDTLELLEDLLSQYDGTVFVVSHDRRFLDNLVTSTLVYEGEATWREYVGNVEDWLTQSARALGTASTRTAAAEKPAADKTRPPSRAGQATRRKLSYKEQQELQTLPTRIEELEREQVSLEAALSSGEIYATDPSAAMQMASRLNEVEALWMEAMERLEALKV